MISIPKICGVCYGSKHALELAYSLAKKYKKVVIYKEILHNSSVIEDLSKRGIFCVSDLNLIEPDTVVLIRAHGGAKDVYEKLKERNITYYDATCPNVLKIHREIEGHYQKGDSIVIIGKKDHPEVIGSNGWCDNRAYIVDSMEAVLKLPSLTGKIFVIAQTTISADLFQDLSRAIVERFSNCQVEVMNTICSFQKKIQDSSISLAKESDYTFVIGGKNSSNTRELFECCKKCCDSSFFSTKKDLLQFLKDHKDITLSSKICLTGGASTPIEELLDYKNLLQFYLEYREKVHFYEQAICEVNDTFLLEDDNSYVKEAVSKFCSLNSGGKYVRAFLIDLGYRLSGKKKNYSTMLALAYETFQTAILIHDDVIDHAQLRRGKKTVPVLYHESFEDLGSSSDFFQKKDDTSTSLAICVGDLGYYFANQLLVQYYGKDKNFSNVFAYYNEIVIRTIKGEIVDVILPFLEEFSSSHSVKLEDVLTISELKTSWYTIVGPFCLGMILSGQSRKSVQSMEKVLLPLGVAFQIQDDLLGIYSDKMKKDSSDISEFKQTLLYYYTISRSSYRDELLQYYGKKNLKESDIKRVREIFELSGAKKFAWDMMGSLYDECRDKLDGLNLDSTWKNLLLGFISYLEMRDH